MFYHLNTSHVKVNLVIIEAFTWFPSNLNTSHVKVNLTASIISSVDL